MNSFYDVVIAFIIVVLPFGLGFCMRYNRDKLIDKAIASGECKPNPINNLINANELNLQGRIIVLCGKCCTGKDTVAKMLDNSSRFTVAVSHTTRPKRVGEKDGVEYHFIDTDTFVDMAKNDAFVEVREYVTHQGVWSYGMSKAEVDAKLNSGKNVVMILDKEGLETLKRSEYGDKIISFYIDVDDSVRLARYLDRDELTIEVVRECARRFEADEDDFIGIDKVADVLIQDENNSYGIYNHILLILKTIYEE